MVRPPIQSGEFKGSLARTVVILLVILSLLPVLLMNTVTYFRSRSLLYDQTAQQLEIITANQGLQLENQIDATHESLNSLITRQSFSQALDALLESPQDSARISDAWTQLALWKNNIAANQVTFDKLMVVLPNKTVLVASDLPLAGKDLSSVYAVAQLVNTDDAVTVFNPTPLYFNRMVTFTAYTLRDTKDNPVITIIGASFPTNLNSVLSASSSSYRFGHSYLFTKDEMLTTITPMGDQIIRMAPNETHEGQIRSVIGRGGGLGRFTNQYNQNLAYVRWLPKSQAALVLELPEYIIYEQVQIFGTTSLIMLAIALLISAVVAYFGSNNVVRPLVELATKARIIAQGDLSQRTSINRRDEIGLLAYSFNRMVEQLSELYVSLEKKVEERASQIRTASEVAQMATSTSSREDIIQRTVTLVVDRFNFLSSSIYLMDETGKYVVLSESNSKNIEASRPRGYRVLVGSESLVGWASANNQVRVISDTTAETFYQNELLLPETRSVVAIPVTIGNQLIGVFEAQSAKVGAFDADTVSALQTLTNSVSTGLQNIRLLESTQFNLDETNLLYRASRQMTQAKDKNELLNVLVNTLEKTEYVSAVFSVEKDHLSIYSIRDPKNPTAVANTQGVTLPLQRIGARLSESSMVLVDNLLQPSEFDSILSFFARRGCRSAAIFAANENGKLSKVVVLGSRDAGAITSASMQLFATLVEVMSTTSERFQILNTLQYRLSELQTLASLSQSISGEGDLPSLYRSLHEQIAMTLGEDAGFMLARYDETRNLVSVAFNSDLDNDAQIAPYTLGDGLISYIIRNRKPLLLSRDLEQKAQALGAKPLGKPARSFLGVPLTLGNEILGALVMQDFAHEDRFDENDLNLLNTLVPQIATSIRNADLLTQMKQALQAYDQERFLLNTLLAAIPDQVFFKDNEARYIRVSNSYAGKLNLPDAQQAVGKSDADLMSAEEAEKIATEDREILTAGEPVLGNILKTTRADGAEAWALESKIPMRDIENNPVGLLGISRDITGLKQAEELAQLRATQLRTASEIARDTSGTLDLDELLTQSVNLVRDRFGFYHSSIFLLDPAGEFAVLRESTGEAGARMKAAGHRLAVGSQSLVGQASSRGEAMVVNDVYQSPDYYANPLLPDTHSELVIPLRVGNRTLGLLDVQSTRVNAFQPEDISILQILADQLAIAISNANLYARTRTLLTQHRLVHETITVASTRATNDEALLSAVQGLQKLLPGNRIAIFFTQSDGSQILRTTAGYPAGEQVPGHFAPGEGAIGQAAKERRPILVKDTRVEKDTLPLSSDTLSQLAVPILYSNTIIGVLNMESSEAVRFDDNDSEVLSSLGNNLGAILFSSNLIAQARQQADRERQLYEVTSKIRRSINFEDILETSTEEITKALRARRARIKITIGEELKETPDPIAQNTVKANGNNGHSSEGTL